MYWRGAIGLPTERKAHLFVTTSIVNFTSRDPT